VRTQRPRKARRPLTASTLALCVLGAPVALAAPAFASSTANEIVYVDDAMNEDGDASLVLRDLRSRTASVLLAPNPNKRADSFFYEGPELSPDG